MIRLLYQIRRLQCATLLLLGTIVPLTAQTLPHSFPADATAASGLTIVRAVELALAHNERALAADARLDAAGARVARARAAFLPRLELQATYTRRAFEVIRTVGSDNITIQSLNALGATATATLAVFDARLFPAFRQVRLDRDAVRNERLNARRTLAFDAANAFLATLGAWRVAEAADRRRDLARENLAAARARAEAQLVGSNDVTRAELEFATAERARTEAFGAAEAARISLGLLIGEEPSDTLQEPGGELESDGDADIRSGSTSAHDRRPELLTARLHADALEAASTQALFSLFPSIALTGQYRVTNEAGFSGRSSNWFVGATMSWTLFDGGAWLADMEERSALAHAAALDARGLERTITAELRLADLALENARAALRQAEVARDAARTNAEEASVLYRQGLTSALDVVDAAVRRFEAEVAHAQAVYALAVARLDSRAAAGLDPFGGELR